MKVIKKRMNKNLPCRCFVVSIIVPPPPPKGCCCDIDDDDDVVAVVNESIRCRCVILFPLTATDVEVLTPTMVLPPLPLPLPPPLDDVVTPIPLLTTLLHPIDTTFSKDSARRGAEYISLNMYTNTNIIQYYNTPF